VRQEDAVYLAGAQGFASSITLVPRPVDDHRRRKGALVIDETLR
jgi:hypothetical protein